MRCPGVRALPIHTREPVPCGREMVYRDTNHSGVMADAYWVCPNPAVCGTALPVFPK